MESHIISKYIDTPWYAYILITLLLYYGLVTLIETLSNRVCWIVIIE